MANTIKPGETMNSEINEITVNGKVYVEKGKDAPKATLKDYCIVRTYSAGVFAGNLVEQDGKCGTVKNARRLWYWSGAASLSQLAVDGVKNPDKCKFPCEVAEVRLTEIIEVIPCTQKAFDSIKEVPVWKA
jgi:hypothetical protein